FPDEESAFRSYASLYPERTVFLIDTYDTLKSGVPNAIKVGKELTAQGKKWGVRLDSGDIHYLSREVRHLLDEAGLQNTTITVSNELDEYIIEALTRAGAPIDSWGVGTNLVTGGNDAAFTGVYKLVARETAQGLFDPVMKFSDNPEKTTTPGIKQVWRLFDEKGQALADVMTLDQEWNGQGPEVLVPGVDYTFYHPAGDYRHFHYHSNQKSQPLLQLKMKEGTLVENPPPLEKLQRRVQEGLEQFDESYKRLLNPHVYKVSITSLLRELKLSLITSYLGDDV
ncbi:MAG: nicotinate phosphoribosyltransferase, partial [Treponemataceae bacterium]|nr:nicotinate phosphoribosyltransferase [Treponemataceae bacterium]